MGSHDVRDSGCSGRRMYMLLRVQIVRVVCGGQRLQTQRHPNQVRRSVGRSFPRGSNHVYPGWPISLARRLGNAGLSGCAQTCCSVVEVVCFMLGDAGAVAQGSMALRWCLNEWKPRQPCDTSSRFCGTDAHRQKSIKHVPHFA